MQEQLDAQLPAVRVQPDDLAATLRILTILGAAVLEQEGAVALDAACPSALHLLIASCTHLYPGQRADPRLAELAARCAHAKRGVPEPPAHALFSAIVNAAAHSSPLLLVRACAESPLCGDWIAAQAAALLSKDARYAEELAAPPSVDGVRSPLHPCTCVLCPVACEESMLRAAWRVSSVQRLVCAASRRGVL